MLLYLCYELLCIATDQLDKPRKTLAVLLHVLAPKKSFDVRIFELRISDTEVIIHLCNPLR